MELTLGKVSFLEAVIKLHYCNFEALLVSFFRCVLTSIIIQHFITFMYILLPFHSTFQDLKLGKWVFLYCWWKNFFIFLIRSAASKVLVFVKYKRPFKIFTFLYFYWFSYEHDVVLPLFFSLGQLFNSLLSYFRLCYWMT